MNPSSMKSFFVTNKRRILLGIIIAAALGAIGWQAYQYYQASKRPSEEQIRLNILRGITAPVTPLPEKQQNTILNTITSPAPTKTKQSKPTQVVPEAQKQSILNSLK